MMASLFVVLQILISLLPPPVAVVAAVVADVVPLSALDRPLTVPPRLLGSAVWQCSTLLVVVFEPRLELKSRHGH